MRSHTAVLATSFALSTSPEGLGVAQLLPAGKFAARDGRPGPGRTWTVTDAQGQLLAASLSAVAGQTPIVIDYEHHTLTAQAGGHKAVASGWIKSAEWRPGAGMFAKVDWTAAARAHIDAREYQYISPVITYDDAGTVTGVALAALVNYPALLGMDAAMASALSALSAQLSSSPTPTDQESTVTLLSALIAGLGLAATTTEAEAIVAVAALKAQVAAPPQVPTALATALNLQAGADTVAACGAVTALQALDTSAKATIAALHGEILQLKNQASGDQVAAAVDMAISEGRLTPAAKDNALAVGRSNFAALQGMLNATPKGTYTSSQTEGKDPGAGKSAALSAVQSEVFAAFGISADTALKHLTKTA